MIIDYRYKIQCTRNLLQSQQCLAALLSVVAISTPMAFADESETETEQELKQKNVGSGDSINENCGQNLIDSDSTQVCGIFTLSD